MRKKRISGFRLGRFYRFADLIGAENVSEKADKAKEKWIEELAEQGFSGRRVQGKSLRGQMVSGMDIQEARKVLSIDDPKKHPPTGLEDVSLGFSHAAIYHEELNLFLSFDTLGKPIGLLGLFYPILFYDNDAISVGLYKDVHDNEEVPVALNEDVAKQGLFVKAFSRGHLTEHLLLYRWKGHKHPFYPRIERKSLVENWWENVRALPLSQHEVFVAGVFSEYLKQDPLPEGTLEAMLTAYKENTNVPSSASDEVIQAIQKIEGWFIDFSIPYWGAGRMSLNPRRSVILQELLNQSDLLSKSEAREGPRLFIPVATMIAKGIGVRVEKTKKGETAKILYQRIPKEALSLIGSIPENAEHVFVPHKDFPITKTTPELSSGEYSLVYERVNHEFPVTHVLDHEGKSISVATFLEQAALQKQAAPSETQYRYYVPMLNEWSRIREAKGIAPSLATDSFETDFESVQGTQFQDSPVEKQKDRKANNTKAGVVYRVKGSEGTSLFGEVEVWAEHYKKFLPYPEYLEYRAKRSKLPKNLDVVDYLTRRAIELPEPKPASAAVAADEITGLIVVPGGAPRDRREWWVNTELIHTEEGGFRVGIKKFVEEGRMRIVEHEGADFFIKRNRYGLQSLIPVGSLIMPILPGTVVGITDDILKQTITIRHDGYENEFGDPLYSFYTHVKVKRDDKAEVYVKVGDEVTEETVISEFAKPNPGWSGSPSHLHFTLKYVESDYVDMFEKRLREDFFHSALMPYNPNFEKIHLIDFFEGVELRELRSGLRVLERPTDPFEEVSSGLRTLLKYTSLQDNSASLVAPFESILGSAVFTETFSYSPPESPSQELYAKLTRQINETLEELDSKKEVDALLKQLMAIANEAEEDEYVRGVIYQLIGEFADAGIIQENEALTSWVSYRHGFESGKEKSFFPMATLLTLIGKLRLKETSVKRLLQDMLESDSYANKYSHQYYFVRQRAEDALRLLEEPEAQTQFDPVIDRQVLHVTEVIKSFNLIFQSGDPVSIQNQMALIYRIVQRRLSAFGPEAVLAGPAVAELAESVRNHQSSEISQDLKQNLLDTTENLMSLIGYRDTPQSGRVFSVFDIPELDMNGVLSEELPTSEDGNVKVTFVIQSWRVTFPKNEQEEIPRHFTEAAAVEHTFEVPAHQWNAEAFAEAVPHYLKENLSLNEEGFIFFDDFVHGPLKQLPTLVGVSVSEDLQTEVGFIVDPVIRPKPKDSKSEARIDGTFARTLGFEIAHGERPYPQDANPKNSRVGDFFFRTVRFPTWIQLPFYDPTSDETFLFLGYRNEENPQELRVYLMGDFVTGKVVLGKATGRFNEDSPIQFQGYFPEELKAFTQKLQAHIGEARIISTNERLNNRPRKGRYDQLREYVYFLRGTDPSEERKIKLKLYLWSTYQQKIVVQLGSERFTLPFRPVTMNDKERRLTLTDSQRRLYFQGRYHDEGFQIESDLAMEFLRHVSEAQNLEKGFGRILDIGGKDTPFSKDIENRQEVVVLDLGAPQEPSQENDVLFVQGNAENLDGLSESSEGAIRNFLGTPSKNETAPLWHAFETVILSFVLNYADFRKILQEVAEKIKPGTRIIIQNHVAMGDQQVFSPQGVKTNRELIESLDDGDYEIEMIYGYGIKGEIFPPNAGDFLASTPAYLEVLTLEQAKDYDGILFISLKRVGSSGGRSEARLEAFSEEAHLKAFFKYVFPRGEIDESQIVELSEDVRIVDIPVSEDSPFVEEAFGSPFQSGDHYFFIFDSQDRLLALARQNDKNQTVQTVPMLNYFYFGRNWLHEYNQQLDLRTDYYSTVLDYLEWIRQNNNDLSLLELTSVDPPVSESYQSLFEETKEVVEKSFRRHSSTDSDAAIRKTVRYEAVQYWIPKWSDRLIEVLFDSDEMGYFHKAPTFFVFQDDYALSFDEYDEAKVFEYLLAKAFYERPFSRKSRSAEDYARVMIEDREGPTTISHTSERIPLSQKGRQGWRQVEVSLLKDYGRGPLSRKELKDLNELAWIENQSVWHPSKLTIKTEEISIGEDKTIPLHHISRRRLRSILDRERVALTKLLREEPTEEDRELEEKRGLAAQFLGDHDLPDPKKREALAGEFIGILQRKGESPFLLSIVARALDRHSVLVTRDRLQGILGAEFIELLALDAELDDLSYSEIVTLKSQKDRSQIISSSEIERLAMLQWGKRKKILEKINHFKSQLSQSEQPLLDKLTPQKVIQLAHRYYRELDALYEAETDVREHEFEAVYQIAGLGKPVRYERESDEDYKKRVEEAVTKWSQKIRSEGFDLASHDKARNQIALLIDREQLFKQVGSTGLREIQLAYRKLGLEPVQASYYYRELVKRNMQLSFLREAIAQDSSIPSEFRRENLEEVLNLLVRVSHVLEDRQNLKDYKKPLVFIFAASHGLGKTTLARRLERLTGLTYHTTDDSFPLLKAEIPKDWIPALHALPFEGPYDPENPDSIDDLLDHFYEHSQAVLGGSTGKGGMIAQLRAHIKRRQSVIWEGPVIVPGSLPKDFYDQANIIYVGIGISDVPKDKTIEMRGRTAQERLLNLLDGILNRTLTDSEALSYEEIQRLTLQEINEIEEGSFEKRNELQLERLKERARDARNPEREVQRYEDGIEKIGIIREELSNLTKMASLHWVLNDGVDNVTQAVLRLMINPFSDNPPLSVPREVVKARRKIDWRVGVKKHPVLTQVVKFQRDQDLYPETVIDASRLHLLSDDETLMNALVNQLNTVKEKVVILVPEDLSGAGTAASQFFQKNLRVSKRLETASKSESRDTPNSTTEITLKNLDDYGEEVVSYIDFFLELINQGAEVEDLTGAQKFGLRVAHNRLVYYSPPGADGEEFLMAHHGVEIGEDPDFPDGLYPVTLELREKTKTPLAVRIATTPKNTQQFKLEILRKRRQHEEVPVDILSLKDPKKLHPETLKLRISFVEGAASSESRVEEKVSKWLYAGALYVAMALAFSFVMAKDVLQTPGVSAINYVTTLFIWSNIWMFLLFFGQTLYKWVSERSVTSERFYWNMTSDEFRVFAQLKRTDKVLLFLNAFLSQFLAPFVFSFVMKTSLMPQVFAIFHTAGAGTAIFIGAYIFGRRMGIESERLRIQHIIGLGLLAAGTTVVVTMIGLQQISGDWLASILLGLGSAFIAVLQPILQKYIIMVRNKGNEEAQARLPFIMTKLGYAFGLLIAVFVFLAFAPGANFSQIYQPHPFIPVLAFIFSTAWVVTYQVYKRMPLPDFVLIRSTSPFWTAMVEFFWLKHAISWMRSLSGSLILAGAWIASWGTYKSQKVAQFKKLDSLVEKDAAVSANSESRHFQDGDVEISSVPQKDEVVFVELPSRSESRQGIPWVDAISIPVSYRASVALVGMANPGWGDEVRENYRAYLASLIGEQISVIQDEAFDAIPFASNASIAPKLVRAFRGVPEMAHPEVQAMIQVARRYPHAYLIFHLSGVSEKERTAFESEFRKQAQRQIKQKRLNLMVVNQFADYQAFLNASQFSRILIFGDATIVELLFQSLNSKVKEQTLFIEADFDGAESLTREAEALLAALDELFRARQLPGAILSGAQLLVQKAAFVEELRTLFSQAA